MKNSYAKIFGPPNPRNLRYDEYFSCNVNYNRSRINALRSHLFRECSGTDLHPECGCTLAITGSDGRLENGKAKMGFMLYTEHFTDFEPELEMVKKTINGYGGGEVFEDIKEIKNLNCDILSYFRNEKDRVFPSRVIDSLYIFGDVSLVKKAKRKICEEIGGKEGKRIIERLTKRRAEYRKVMLSGEQRFRNRSVRHYSLEEGVSYYNPAEGQASFKYGPLRFVQQSLVRDILRMVRRKRGWEIIKYLPCDTKSRFMYFESESLSNLSKSEISDIVDSYMYFLWNYHVSQWIAEKSGVTETEFDRSEVRERINSLNRILSKPVLKIQT